MAKFKHPILSVADRHPILFALFGWAVLFELPSSVIGKTYRQTRYGDYRLGSVRPYAPGPDQGIYKGDLYRDTNHMNGQGSHGPGGRSVGVQAGDPLYRDTRHLTPSLPSPEASASTHRFAPHQAPIGQNASQSLVDLHTGNSVFAGLSGVQKLWGERR